jgi:pimeloyl-ACP methyl ester carboxylesterase
MPEVTITGARRGAGRPLVLLHTLGADHRMWDPVLERLARARDVLALDLPGFGGSPPVDAASPGALASAITGWLAARGIERPHVAGNSLGGWVALEMAATGHAASVTAIAPAGLWARPLAPKRATARALARLLLPVLAPLLRWPAARRLALGGTMARPENVPAADALRLVRSYATAPGFDAANAAMRGSRFTALGAIDVPVTLVWPEHDRLVRRLQRIPHGVRSIDLAGCGHLPTWDDPERVAQVLLEGSGG